MAFIDRPGTFPALTLRVEPPCGLGLFPQTACEMQELADKLHINVVCSWNGYDMQAFPGVTTPELLLAIYETRYGRPAEAGVPQ